MSPEFFQKYWKIIFAIFALLWYFFGVMSYQVQGDARKRGLSKAAVTFWSVSVVFFGPIFLPLYYIFRSNAIFAAREGKETGSKRYSLCPHCGEKNPIDKSTCQKCGKPMDPNVPTVGTKGCPYCGAINPVNADRCSSCDQVIGFSGGKPGDDD